MEDDTRLRIRWLAPLAPAFVAAALSAGALRGSFVWDDRIAVLENRDVSAATPWHHLLRHDFWGQDITLPGSHKSFRPLAVASYRVDRLLWRLSSDANDANSGSGLDPTVAGPAMHATNVVLHALNCAMTVPLYNRALKGPLDGSESARGIAALLASVLFAVHPVHVEPVASLVGRADLLCASFVLFSLLVAGAGRFETAAHHLSSAKKKNGGQQQQQRQARRFQPGALRFAAALLFGTAACVCKEIGVAAFGLLAVHEALRVLFVEDGVSYVCNNIRRPLCVVRRLWKSAFRCFLCVLCAGTVVWARLRLHSGAGLRKWGVFENDIAELPEWRARALAYSYMHARYAWLLLWPMRLCYDWGFRCIPRVESISDVQNLATAALYASLLAAVIYGLRRRDVTLLWGLAMLFVPFLPASQIFFPVGTVLAERLLYLPSVGACLLAVHAAGCVSSLVDPKMSIEVRRDPSKASDDNIHGKQQPQNDAAVPGLGGEEARESREFEKASLNGSSGSSTSADIRRRRRPVTAPTTLNGNTNRAPYSHAAAKGAVFTASFNATSHQMTERLRRLGGRLPYWLLWAWAVGFSVRSVSRISDWNTERHLFEAALRTCPDGIKNLNNLATVLLGGAQAAEAAAFGGGGSGGGGSAHEEDETMRLQRADLMLSRAIELHPNYPTARANHVLVKRRAGDLEGSAKAAVAALAADQNDANSLLYLGESLLRMHEEEVPATPGLKALLANEFCSPTSSNSASVDRAGSSCAWSEGALLAEEDWVLRAAEAAFGRLSALTTNSAVAFSAWPLLWHCRGRISALRGAHAEAVGFFETAVTANAAARPDELVDEAETLNLGALSARDAFGPAAAAASFDAALLRQPGSLPLLVNGALAHYDAGNVIRALELGGEAVRLHPGSAEAATNIGWLRERQGDLIGAHELYRRAVVLAGHQPHPQMVQNLKSIREKLGLE